MKKAIFPGTFDPPTLGHLDIIKRASKLVDSLIIAVGQNPIKTVVFSAKERVQLIEAITTGITNITVVHFDGLLVDFAKKEGVSVVIRSIRNVNDFDEETLQASMNHRMTGLETLIMVPDDKVRFISSTLARNIAKGGRRLHEFVPKEIEEQVYKRLVKY